MAKAITGLLGRLEGVRPASGGFMAKCPAHEDNKASLKISEGEGGKAVLHCHANCETKAILDAVGMSWGELFDQDQPESTGEWMPGNVTAVAVYDYTEADGKLRYQVLRSPTKDFKQRRPDPSTKSGWRWSLGEVRSKDDREVILPAVERTIYRLPAVLDAVRDGKVINICEGEKDVQAFEAKGEVATCNSGGAGKWSADMDQHFVGATVTIVSDKDEPGRKHARQVHQHLSEVANSVRIVEAAEGCKDAAEHFAKGHGPDDFVVTHGPAEAPEDLMEDIYAFIAGEDVWDWVVPGLLEHRDRLMLTGPEGFGKSVLIRQLAVALASGVHPFTFKEITPVRVMVVDCENGEAFSRREYRNLTFERANKGIMPADGAFRIKVRTNGLNLLDPDDEAWLIERLTAYEPDVLFIGPLYKLHTEDPNKAQPAAQLQATLDRLRDASGCALVMEAHAGHGDGFERKMRPEGHSSWMRWPEFGYGLVPDREVQGRAHFRQWRGPRDERDFPEALTRGRSGEWPWGGEYPRGMPSHELLRPDPVGF